LPVETLESIIDNIDRCKDLLNLALTCSQLRDLIIPNHIEYRYIRCDPYRRSLWTKLIQQPRLASNIRILDLSDEKYPDRCWP
ncbi:hypothetical protein M422DRAFT_132354, partial [Sphaerobolus stellatus SS14]